MKRISLLFLIFSWGIYGAMAQEGYFVTDSSRTIGVNIVNQGDKDNARYCVVEGSAHERTTYKPTQVKEYRIGSDQVYVSRLVNKQFATTHVFLRRDVEGKINLLANLSENEPTLFVEGKDLKFTELKRGDEFREQLRAITADCEDVTANLPLVKYNRSAIKRYITDYNKCRKGLFPHQRFGIYGFYEVKQVSNYKYNVYDGLLEYAPEKMFSAGISADFPIYRSYFSLHPELQYSAYKSANTFFIDNKSIILDFIEESKIIKMPVLMRYTLLSSQVRPFANFGPTAAYCLQYKGDNYQTIKNGNVITIEGEAVDRKGTIYGGLSAGIGAEYSLSLHLSLFAEVRYSYYLPSGDILKYSDTQFVTGITF